MPAKTLRIPLVESVDYLNGYISDGIVDLTTERKTFMARPSLQAGTQSGACNGVLGLFIFKQKAITEGSVTYFNTYTGIMDIDSGSGKSRLSLFDFTGSLIGRITSTTNQLTPYSSQMCAPCSTPLSIDPLNTMVAIASGGSGYAVNDQITLNTTPNASAPVYKVTTISSGAVTGVSLVSSGLFSATPSNPVAQLSTTGTGTGATFNFNVSSGQFAVVSGILGQESDQQGSNLLFAGAAQGGTNNDGFFVGTQIALPVGQAKGYVASIINLSGYNFALDNSGNIYNSNAGDCLTWDALSFIQAFSNDDTQPVTLSSHDGYLIAFGSDEIRLFQVTGTTPGSSISPILNTTYGMGCFSQKTVASSNEFLMWIGAFDGTGLGVHMMQPSSLVPKRVSYPYLENLLSTLTITSCNFCLFRGHIAYSINTSTGISYVYDIAMQQWYVWNVPATSNGHAMDVGTVFNGESYYANYDSGLGNYYTLTVNSAGTDIIVSSGTNVPVSYLPFVVTSIQDYGSLKNKQYASCSIVGDQVPVSSNLIANLSYTDDDAQTYSTPRTITLGQQYPVVRNLGQSRRRSWKLAIPADWRVRVDALEISVMQGSS